MQFLCVLEIHKNFELSLNYLVNDLILIFWVDNQLLLLI